MKKVLLFGLSLLMVTTMTFAQDRTVSGKVSSADDGSSLPGVNVVLKGTTNGAVTDIDGNYKLTVPEEGGTLTYSFIGLVSQDVEIGSRSVIDLNMESDVQQLSEVVVSALGVEKDEKAIGYAVQSVDANEITKARETNLVNALSGRVAGVQITSNSGGVGGSSRIVIRGPSSITGNNQPLFIVDGVPIDNTQFGDAGSGGGTDYGNGAGEINPDDIETMTVLKGANAAALYGSRASNGVILITTKSGKGTKGIGVSVNHTTQFTNPLRTPDFQNSYGQSNEKFFEWVDGSNGEGGIDESWGMPLDIGLEAVQWQSNGTSPTPWVSQPTNLTDFLEQGVQNSTNVSVQGGNDLGNFRLSIGNLDEVGMLPNTDLRRNNIGLNAGYNLSEKLRAEFTSSYVNSRSDNRPVTGYTGSNPIQQFIWSGRQVDYNALRDYENLPLATAGPAEGSGAPTNWNTRFQNNPYWSADNLINNHQKDRLYGNVRLSYEIMPYLTIMGRTGLDYFTELRERKIAIGIESEPNGLYRRYNRTRNEINSDFLLTFDNDIAGDFHLTAMFGGSNRTEYLDNTITEAPELELPGVYNLSNVRSGVAVTASNYRSEKVVNSLYGSAQFGWRNSLFVDFTARNDWSSTLPTENNSYFYPSVNLSAVITDLADIQSNVLSYLKIRGGWAQVGNDTGPYNLEQVFAFRDKWGATLEPTVNNRLLNPDLKPEITTSVEIGLDARFFNGRIKFDVTYYDGSTKDQIIPITISGASGYTSRFANIGEMTNKGVEMQLQGTIIDKAVKWDMFVNFSRNVNEVVSLAPGLDQLEIGGQWNVDVQAVPGQPYGALFGPAYLRDTDGNIIHKNGLPEIDTEYQTIGNVMPDWTAGIGTSVSWKGLKFDALVDAKMGGDVYSMTYAWGRYAGVLNETLLGREEGIVGVGVIDNGDGTFRPNDVVATAKSYNQRGFSNSLAESSVFDASYVKLRQLSLGYTFNNSLFGNFPLKDLQVAIVGRNLALLYSKAPHIDPETSFNSGNAQGLEFGQLPSGRSIGFNVSFKF